MALGGAPRDSQGHEARCLGADTRRDAAHPSAGRRPALAARHRTTAVDIDNNEIGKEHLSSYTNNRQKSHRRREAPASDRPLEAP